MAKTQNLDNWESFLDKVSRYAADNINYVISLGNENKDLGDATDLIEAYSSVTQAYSEHFRLNLELLRQDEGFERIETADLYLKLSQANPEEDVRKIMYNLENSSLDIRGLRNLREMTDSYLEENT